MSLPTLLLLLTCAVAYTAAQVSKTIESADQSVTNIVPLYVNRAQRAWLGPNGMHELFAQLQTARLQVVVDMAPLVSNATAAAVADALAADACLVAADPTVYMLNATAYQEFLCCQLALWQMPGLPAVVSAIYQNFLPGTPALDWSTASGLPAIAQIRALDTNSTNIVRCKDDTRIHIPESQLMQAQSVAAVAGTILRALQYASQTLQSCAACLAPLPPAACLSSAPVNIAAAAAMLTFYEAAPPFQAVCGQGVLRAFEVFRTGTTWCAIV